MQEQPCWLAEAWRELGQSEIAGRRHNPRITAMFKELGHQDHARDEVAWCAAFVGAMLERAGYASTRSLMARSYSKFGAGLSQERLGAIAVLSRGGDPAFGHVGFLVGWSGEKFWLLGGNQGNSVSVAAFDRSRLVSLRWPQATGSSVDVAENEKEDPFGAALAHVLEMEGGYTNDPHDPGGPTNKGITLETFAAWRRADLGRDSRRELIAELKAISDEEVRAIYRRRYWRPAGCEEFTPTLAFFHFDAAVNHGVRGATRMLQEAVGAVVDGEIGPETRGKITRMPILKLIALYAAIRRKRYRELPHFWRFGKGWLRRVDRTLAGAREIEDQRGDENGQPSEREGARTMTTASEDGAKWWGKSLTIWGAFITAAAAVLPTIGPIIGLDINAAMVRELGDQALSVAQALTALIGTVMTVYGRARAVHPLVRRDITLKL